MPGQYVRPGVRKRAFKASEIHREPKKWGEEQWIVNKEYCGKKLILKKNHRCSMHSHKEKDEVFYVQSGKVKLEIEGKAHILSRGDFVHIEPKVEHRFTGLEDSEIFEFSTHHDEDDSYRTEFSGHVEQDRYDREIALIKKKFPKVSILVIGDSMIDMTISGSVDRVSPEAPIPVVHKRSSLDTAGGAGNAARNAATLGAKTVCLSVSGKDAEGKRLQMLLTSGNVTPVMLTDANRRTTAKIRVIGNGNQIVRLDYEETHPITSALERSFLSAAAKRIRKADVLLLSDYGKGLFTPTLLRKLIALARKAKVPVVLDPKPRGPEYIAAVRGVTLLTPNRAEAALLAGRSTHSDPKSNARAIAKKTRSTVLVTLGGEGMLLCDAKGKMKTFPALAREVADVTGAGDTVAAVLALVLGAEGSLDDAVDLANRAASIVVGKRGTATVTPEELSAIL